MRMAQFAQGTRLDLADTLAGNPKLAPDLLKRAIAAIEQAVTQLKDLTFALGQLLERRFELLAQHMLGCAFEWRSTLLILNKVAEDRIALGANRSFQRDRLARGV